MKQMILLASLLVLGFNSLAQEIGFPLVTASTANVVCRGTGIIDNDPNDTAKIVIALDTKSKKAWWSASLKSDINKEEFFALTVKEWNIKNCKYSLDIETIWFVEDTRLAKVNVQTSGCGQDVGNTDVKMNATLISEEGSAQFNDLVCTVTSK